MSNVVVPPSDAERSDRDADADADARARARATARVRAQWWWLVVVVLAAAALVLWLAWRWYARKLYERPRPSVDVRQTAVRTGDLLLCDSFNTPARGVTGAMRAVVYGSEWSH